MQNNVSCRLLDFASVTIELAPLINRGIAGRIICEQMIRSATSAGANYEEACGAESKADFTHKLQIVLKELKETHYWLRLLEKTKLLSFSSERIKAYKVEALQLVNIIAKSVVTVKKSL